MTATTAPPVVPFGMPLSRAFGLALALELLAVVGAAAWLERAPPPPPPPLPAMIVQLDRVSPPAEQPPPPSPPKAETPPVPKVETPPPKPPPPQKPRAVVKEVPHLVPPPPEAPVLPAASEIPAEPSPPAPAATAAAATETAAVASAQRVAEDDFATHLHAAVQAATRYPAAARAMGRQGRVRMAFDFLDGEVSNVEVVQSGDLPAFDAAATSAVEDAHYPPSPPHWRHQKKRLMVWVEFLKKGY